ncbi:hypothetical protein BC938DRAFT_478014 [Jimgerdemannia flammicorona]|uniref:Uncharacterized protein n=1 Tax=Jimgerdemannia flammicorona TaxID=994334 RepID=A0A433P6N6_9FUNG|nr:hypothetical protein BC938DRAFT_478014 [Jimgerdemannia flammicorona]
MFKDDGSDPTNHDGEVEAIEIEGSAVATWDGYDKAEPLYGQALTIREKMLGSRHGRIPEQLGCALRKPGQPAGLYKSRGNYNGAKQHPATPYTIHEGPILRNDVDGAFELEQEIKMEDVTESSTEEEGQIFPYDIDGAFKLQAKNKTDDASVRNASGKDLIQPYYMDSTLEIEEQKSKRADVERRAPASTVSWKRCARIGSEQECRYREYH